jgi:hypothetical protein
MLELKNVIYVEGYHPAAEPPIWNARVALFVWHLPFICLA